MNGPVEANTLPAVKEFKIQRFATDSDLCKYAREGWQIQFMQFQGSDLHVVFQRDMPKPTPVSASPVATAGNVMMFDPKPATQWLTRNPIKQDTRKIVVSAKDPIIQEAFAQGQAVFNRVVSDGQAALKSAASSFNSRGERS